MNAYCSNCSNQRQVGVSHRCPASKLVALTDAAQLVIDTIITAGGSPLIVGGSVRDAFYGLPVKDIDIEVYGLADKDALKRALSAIGRIDERGVSFGVLVLRVGGEDFDVSFPRSETSTGDGHRGFITNIDPFLDEATAFGRRDYTLNAMGWDPQTGELVDPWGGLADLNAGILRHTTSAYVEDPLRVLRAVQFSARFNLTLAPETAALAASISDRFHTISSERVWGEVIKLVTLGRNISAGLRALHDSGWEPLFPELAGMRDVPQSPEWHPEGAVHVHAGLAADRAVVLADRDGLEDDARAFAVLSALLHDVGKAGKGTRRQPDGRITAYGHDVHSERLAGEFLSRLRAPAKFHDHILPLVRHHMNFVQAEGRRPRRAFVRSVLRKLGDKPHSPTLTDWARLVDADVNGRGLPVQEAPAGSWLEVEATLGPDTQKVILRGEHLVAHGLPKGPGYAYVIRASIEAQDAGEFEDEAGALHWLEANGSAVLEEGLRQYELNAR